MWGDSSKTDDIILFDRVSTSFRRYKKVWENKLKKVRNDVTIHLVREIPYTIIKDAMGYKGINSDHIATLTDGGSDKTNKTDGGVIYAKLNNIDVCLPIAWFETKSSNSCTKGKGTRGQATGLIAEQAARCTSWAKVVDKKIKPLIAFMKGSDFNLNRGCYNIDRIKVDLHTSGNICPYDEDDSDCVSWLYYQENFTINELDDKIYEAISKNVEVLSKILENF